MMMNETIEGLDLCFVYLDDIMIYSTSKREYLDHLWQVIDYLHKENIKNDKMWLFSKSKSIT